VATSVQVPISEYLNTSYRPDREYVDGELLERNVGKNEHSRLQALLTGWFIRFEEAWGVAAFTEQRVQVSATRVRIPDVLLVPVAPHPEVLVEPPILVVEILSPDDSYAETQRRANDYLSMGVGTIWIIDPVNRTGRACVGKAWIESETLTVLGTEIWVSLPELFDRLSRTLPDTLGSSGS
jgi:Uma2 family endonuclease